MNKIRINRKRKTSRRQMRNLQDI